MRDYTILELASASSPSDSPGVLLAGPEEAEASPNQWVEIATVEAANDQQAIRKATDDRDPAQRSGTFVAVPSRSFKPRTRATETVVRDRWS